MNERIVELFMQSVDSNYIPLPIEDHIPSWTEKFAELIVRDCMKQIYGCTKISFPEYQWSDKEIGYNEGIDTAYKKVKRHFGVK